MIHLTIDRPKPERIHALHDTVTWQGRAYTVVARAKPVDAGWRYDIRDAGGITVGNVPGSEIEACR